MRLERERKRVSVWEREMNKGKKGNKNIRLVQRDKRKKEKIMLC